MAGVWADPFDWYNTAQIGRVYDVATGSYLIGAYGPSGRAALRMSGDRTGEVRRLSVTWVSGNTAVFEFDFRVSALPSQSNRFLSVGDGGHQDANAQVELNLETDGKIRAHRGHVTSDVTLGTSTYAVTPGVFVHFSVKFVVDPGAGSVQVTVYPISSSSGTQILNLTGVNTARTGNAQWDTFVFGAACDGTTDFSAAVVMDGSGSRNNDRVGPVAVYSKRPTTDGAHTDSTPLTGTSRAAMLTESAADDDTSYNELTGASDLDTFEMQDVSVTDLPLFSALVWQPKKTSGGGTVGLQPVAREGSTDTVGSVVLSASAYTGSVTPVLYQQLPSGPAWSAATWNAMQWGYQLNEAAGVRITQVVALVVVQAGAVTPDAYGDDGDPGPIATVTLTDREEGAHPFAAVDLNDPPEYYDGYKAPKVVQFAPIRTALSDASGAITHPTFGAVISDTDYELRALFDDPTKKFLTGAPLVVRTVSDEDRRALLPMRHEMVGFVTDYAPTPDLQFVVNGSGWLRMKLARKTRAPEFWVPLLTRATFTQLPAALVNKAAPLVYGKVTDEPENVSGPVTVPADLYPRGNADPGWLGWGYDYQVGGSLNITRYYIYGTTITGGVESQVIAFELGITMDAGHLSFYVYVKTAATPDLYRFYFSDDGAFNPFTNPLAGTFARYLDVAPGALVENPYGPPNDLKYVLIDDEANGEDYHALVDNGASAVLVAPKGDVPTHYIGDETYGGITRSAFLVCRAAVKAITGVFLKDVQQSSTGSATELECPFLGDYATTFGANYRDINGERWTIVYATGQTALNAINGTAPITVNVWGIETVGDTTGELITCPAKIEQHFERNFLAAETVPGTTWLTVAPNLPIGAPLQDDVSYDAVEAALVARLSGGYEAAGIINADLEPERALDVLASLHVAGDYDWGTSRIGQSSVTAEPTSAPAEEDALALTDVLHIVDRSFEARIELSQYFWNVIPFLATKDYVGRTTDGWGIRGESRDAASIDGYGQEQVATQIEFRWLRTNTAQGRATLVDVVQRKRTRYRHPRRTAALTAPYLSCATVTLGSVLRLTALEGLGAAGWVGHDVRVIEIETNLNQLVRKFIAYDLQPIYDGLDDAVEPTQEALGERPETLTSLIENVRDTQADLSSIQAELEDQDTRISTLESATRTLVFGIVIDGGGEVITAGVKGFVRIPVACVITKVTVLSIDEGVTSGSIVVDVWKDTYANFPPTNADSITASAPPTLSSATKSEDSTLTGWTTSVAAGDVVGFNVDSATDVTKVIVEVEATA